MKKEQVLQHWQNLEEDMPLSPTPIEYKHEGSTYDCDGIRITGSQAFIDSVLSRLKDMLLYESGETRLQLVYKQSTDRETRAPLDSFNCYIQVHERGGEAKMVNAFVHGIQTGSFGKLEKEHGKMLKAAGF